MLLVCGQGRELGLGRVGRRVGCTVGCAVGGRCALVSIVTLTARHTRAQAAADGDQGKQSCTNDARFKLSKNRARFKLSKNRATVAKKNVSSPAAPAMATPTMRSVVHHAESVIEVPSPSPAIEAAGKQSEFNSSAIQPMHSVHARLERKRPDSNSLVSLE